MNANDIEKVTRLLYCLEKLTEGVDQLKNEKDVFPAKSHHSPSGFRGFGFVSFSPAIKTIAIADYEAAIEATKQKLRALGVSFDEGSAE